MRAFAVRVCLKSTADTCVVSKVAPKTFVGGGLSQHAAVFLSLVIAPTLQRWSHVFLHVLLLFLAQSNELRCAGSPDAFQRRCTNVVIDGLAENEADKQSYEILGISMTIGSCPQPYTFAICIYACMSVCMFVCMYLCVYFGLYVCMYVRMNVTVDVFVL